MKKSAGILLYRDKNKDIEVFLVHPGGPFWKGKDVGAWSIPKGEMEEGEIPLEVAIREFKEETGYTVQGNFIPLTNVIQKSGKLVMAWMLKGDVDASAIVSNSFEMKWPNKSGRKSIFPEVDKAAWFSPEVALNKINVGQAAFIEELLQKLKQHMA